MTSEVNFAHLHPTIFEDAEQNLFHKYFWMEPVWWQKLLFFGNTNACHFGYTYPNFNNPYLTPIWLVTFWFPRLQGIFMEKQTEANTSVISN